MQVPARMTAGQINKELDRLDGKRSELNDAFIAAGRGHETSAETWKKDDALAVAWKALAERRMQLQNEIELRYGPRAPSRLPTRGFPPRERG